MSGGAFQAATEAARIFWRVTRPADVIIPLEMSNMEKIFPKGDNVEDELIEVYEMRIPPLIALLQDASEDCCRVPQKCPRCSRIVSNHTKWHEEPCSGCGSAIPMCADYCAPPLYEEDYRYFPYWCTECGDRRPFRPVDRFYRLVALWAIGIHNRLELSLQRAYELKCGIWACTSCQLYVANIPQERRYVDEEAFTCRSCDRHVPCSVYCSKQPFDGPQMVQCDECEDYMCDASPCNGFHCSECEKRMCQWCFENVQQMLDCSTCNRSNYLCTQCLVEDPDETWYCKDHRVRSTKRVKVIE